MSANYTTNKSLIQPVHGSYNNTWDQPVNADWAALDTCLGGYVVLTVTGVASGTYTLTLGQYQPPNIIISGTLGGNIAYVLPPGVGGFYSVLNQTSGAFNITFGSSGGSSVAIPQGGSTAVITDGATMRLWDSSTANNAASAAQTAAEAFTTAQVAATLTTAETFTTNSVAAATTALETYANGTTGTNSNGTWVRLPGGQLFQFGTSAGQPSSPITVTLPTTFATCESIGITLIGQFGNYFLSAVTSVRNNFVLNFGASNQAFSWQAFGT